MFFFAFLIQDQNDFKGETLHIVKKQMAGNSEAPGPLESRTAEVMQNGRGRRRGLVC